jgi:hypothetical protein
MRQNEHPAKRSMVGHEAGKGSHIEFTREIPMLEPAAVEPGAGRLAGRTFGPLHGSFSSVTQVSLAENMLVFSRITGRYSTTIISIGALESFTTRNVRDC